MPKGRLGVGDIMLAQKLALELFEDEAVKAANKTLPDPVHLGSPPYQEPDGTLAPLSRPPPKFLLTRSPQSQVDERARPGLQRPTNFQ
jgi:hypothetical protein